MYIDIYMIVYIWFILTSGLFPKLRNAHANIVTQANRKAKWKADSEFEVKNLF